MAISSNMSTSTMGDPPLPSGSITWRIDQHFPAQNNAFISHFEHSPIQLSRPSPDDLRNNREKYIRAGVSIKWTTSFLKLRHCPSFRWILGPGWSSLLLL